MEKRFSKYHPVEKLGSMGESDTFTERRFGKYTLVDLLGTGGMAEVYKARIDGPGGFKKHHAVKMILPNLSGDPDFISMFEREATLSAMLDHANIVRVHDFEQVEDRYYLAMEYVDGCNLSKLIWRCRKLRRRLRVPEAVMIGVELCRGLAYAHGELTPGSPTVLHRDISPANIILSRAGEVKITDFGIAKIAGILQKINTGVKGKFTYMSPEQADGLPLDARTDIFGAGCVLWELLVCGKLFKPTENKIPTQDKSIEIKPPSEYNKAVPWQLDQVVLEALERDRERRIGSATELGYRLEEILESFPGVRRNTDLAGLYRELFGENSRKSACVATSLGNVTRREVPAPVQIAGVDKESSCYCVAGGPSEELFSWLPPEEQLVRDGEISPPISPRPCPPSSAASRASRSLFPMLSVLLITALATIATAFSSTSTSKNRSSASVAFTKLSEALGAHGNEPAPGQGLSDSLDTSKTLDPRSDIQGNGLQGQSIVSRAS